MYVIKPVHAVVSVSRYRRLMSGRPPVFLNTVSPLVGRQLFVGGGHPGHKISGWADTPLRTRFRTDGRKSFLARTCTGTMV